MKKASILLICISLNLGLLAQSKSVIPDDKKLIADETEVVSSGAKKFRVITSNEEISSLIEKKYKKDKVVSINMVKKLDKHHSEIYWEVAYYFLNDDYDDVISYIGIISKPKKK